MVVWRFCDGKAGHERQTAGLLKAFSAQRTVEVRDIDVRELRSPIVAFLRRKSPLIDVHASPSLLVGAGRACQWPMLAAQRAHGGHTVYCMKPGLPVRCFDWCLIPHHDGAEKSSRVEPTLGVLNDIVPTPAPLRDRRLILIGGPSRHHHWDEDDLLKQVASLVFGRRDEEIIISDSRRTPVSTSEKLRSFARLGVTVASHHATSGEWLAETLAQVTTVWVSADSVSMLFEVLTAGRALGVLSVPARRADRITRIADDLIAQGLAVSFEGWVGGAGLQVPAPLAEATRCAQLMATRWFPVESA
jgi:uncharacterized protein